MDTTHQGLDEIRKFLSNPRTYPEPTRKVQLLETHISYIFLTDRYAYKLKKPVKLDFLDFSRPEQRIAACRAEVRLNRRLAPEIYLGVVPIVHSGGRLHLGGEGEQVDAVVRMKRLPADRMLDRLIASRSLTVGELSDVAELLGRFYVELPPASITPEEYLQETLEHVRGNLMTLLASPIGRELETEIKAAHAAQLAYIQLHRDELLERVRTGKIVEGHGDLRPEHICLLDDGPVVFDCIEFNERLRTLDIADELAFFAVECEALGSLEPGETVFEAYQSISGDHPPESLVDFYKSYRACVRAKVAAVRSSQMDERHGECERAKAKRYLDLAARHAVGLAPKLAIVVGGAMGSGKTTLAAALAAKFGAEHLETDGIRRGIFGNKPLRFAYGEGKYSSENRLRVYHELLRRAGEVLDDGLPVIIDGTFGEAELRESAAEMARSHGAWPVMIWCECPSDVAKARIEKRLVEGESASEARIDLVDAQRADITPPSGETMPLIKVSTTGSVEDAIAAVLEGLREKVREKAPGARTKKPPRQPRVGDPYEQERDPSSA